MATTTASTQQARTVNTADHGKLDVRSLVLLAVLLRLASSSTSR